MKVKIPEWRYLGLLNKERLLKTTEAVQHRHCEEYKADAEKWRNLRVYGVGSDEQAYEAVRANAELGALVRMRYQNYVSKCNDVNASPYSLDLWLEERCPPDAGPVVDEQNQADSRLGALVRKMKSGDILACTSEMGHFRCGKRDGNHGVWPTPEEALRFHLKET